MTITKDDRLTEELIRDAQAQIDLVNERLALLKWPTRFYLSVSHDPDAQDTAEAEATAAEADAHAACSYIASLSEVEA